MCFYYLPAFATAFAARPWRTPFAELSRGFRAWRFCFRGGFPTWTRILNPFMEVFDAAQLYIYISFTFQARWRNPKDRHKPADNTKQLHQSPKLLEALTRLDHSQLFIPLHVVQVRASGFAIWRACFSCKVIESTNSKRLYLSDTFAL